MVMHHVNLLTIFVADVPACTLAFTQVEHRRTLENGARSYPTCSFSAERDA